MSRIAFVLMAGGLGLCFGLGSAHGVPEASMPIAQRVDGIVRAYHEAGAFDGAVLVIREGAVVYAGGVGPANRTWGMPTDADTRFQICSVTKQFTAVLIMQLVGEDRIDLGQPITTYAIVEAVEERPFAASLRSRILEPLGMKDTGMLRFETVVPRLATGYRRVGEAYEHRLFFGQLGYAAAGMYSTANDLGRWNQALLDHTLLTPELTRTMFSPAVLGGDTGNYVALGSWVYKRPLPPENEMAPRLVERRGYIEPFTALNVLCPDERHAFVILSNTDPCDIHTLPYAPGLPLDLLQVIFDRAPSGPPDPRP